MRNLVPLFFAAAPLLGAPCDPAKPAPCNPDGCTPTYCLGPSLTQGNAPVRPYTCDGDFEISASLLYWKATQDGMVYGAHVKGIEREFLSPNFEWHPGFKIGVGYNSPCDGWDIGVEWTNYKGKAANLNQASTTNALSTPSSLVVPADGESLAVLWSAFQGTLGVYAPSILATVSSFTPFAGELRTSWSAVLNGINIELGRDYWVSKYLTIHPFLGVEYGSIEQNFGMEIFGGYWSEVDLNIVIGAPVFQPALTGEVRVDNDYHGLGVVSGFDLNFYFGCGWSLYSHLAGAILYGEFNIKHNENIREAESPFSKTKILETTNHFKASRGILDLGLGVEWSTLVSESKYLLTVQLGWEKHLYFHQNQMWRVNRELSTLNLTSIGVSGIPNNSGENAQYQKQGTLSTNGLTFTLKFDF